MLQPSRAPSNRPYPCRAAAPMARPGQPSPTRRLRGHTAPDRYKWPSAYGSDPWLCGDILIRCHVSAGAMARLTPDDEKTDAQLIADRLERLDLTLGTIEYLLRRLLNDRT